ncbi:MAG: beta strand repeat-containing protein, partial [Gemmatimonadaceae bacterium]
GSTLRVRGQSNGGSAAVAFASGFENFGLIELTSVDGGFSSSLTLTSGAIDNDDFATIRSSVGAGGTRTLTAQLVNRGTLDVDQPLTINGSDADHVNAGTIDLTNANLAITQSGTSPSFLNVNPGNPAGGVINIGANRTLTVSGGTVDMQFGSVTGPPSATMVVNNSAVLAFTPPSIGVPLTLLSSTVVGGAVTIADGETLRLLSGVLPATVTMQGGGTLAAYGTVSLNGNLTVPQGALVQAIGSSIGGSASVTVANSFTNGGRIELTSTDGGFTSIFAVASGNTLFNGPTGVIYSGVGAGGQRTLAAQISNDGTIEVDQPLTLQATNADHSNSGSIDLTAANLNVTLDGTTPSFTNTGAISLGANRTLTIGGGAVNLAAGTLTGPTTSVLAVTGSTLAFTTSTVSVPMTLTTTTIANGPVTIPADQTLTLLNGGFAEPVTVQGGGQLLTHGTVNLNTVTMLPGGILRVQGDPTGGSAALTIASGFNNQGTIDLTSITGGFSSSLTVSSGELNNSGTITSAVGAGGARTLAAQLTNVATVTVNQPLILDRASSQHVNGGTIDLTNANLTVTQTGTTPRFSNGAGGQIILGANRQMVVTGGEVHLAEGLVSGPGTATAVITNAQLEFTATNVTVPLTLNNTTIIGGQVTVGDGQTMVMLSGGLTDPITVQGGGVLVVHGIVALNGALAIDASAVLRVQGDPTGGSAALTVAQGFFNHGLIELTSITGGFSAQLAVTANSLTNSADGTILSMPGAGGTRTLLAQLENAGTLDIDQPLTINRASAQHQSSGTILLDAGFTVVQSGTSPTFVLNNSVTIAANTFWTVTGGTLDIGEGTVTGTATSRLIVTDATFSFFPNNVNVPLTLTNVTLGNGPLNIGDSQTTTLLGGGLSQDVNISGGGTLVIHGVVALNGPVQLNGGELRVEGDPTGGSAQVVFGNTITNSGLIVLTSVTGGFASQITMNSGSLVNTTDGTISSDPGAGGARFITAQLDNQGVLDINASLTLNRLDAQHTNSGGVDVSANLTVTLNAAGSFTNTSSGTMQLLGSSRIFGVTGGTLDLGQGLVSSPETDAMLSVNSASSFSFTPGTVTLPMQIVNTTIAGGGFTVGTSQTVTLINSNLPAVNAVSILGGGTLVIRGGTTFNGPLTQGGNLRIQGAGFGGGAVLTVANGFTNNGFIELTSIVGGFGAQLIVTSGPLVNAANGDISSSLGTGGSRTLTAQLDNLGGLDVHQPLVINSTGANHTSSGTFDISSNLTITGSASLTSTGELFVSANQTLTVASGTVTNGAGGSVVGTGTLNVTGATFVNNGSISPDANGTGTFTITGNYTQGTGSVNINMSGTNCSQFDRLVISGTAVLTGTTLNVLPSCLSSPLNLQQFNILTTGGLTGTFTPNIPILPGGVLLQPQYDTNNLVLNALIS